jgi:hypothetical protein
MKEFGIILNFKDKMITIDEIILPMINNLQGAGTLCEIKHNHSLAMEPQSSSSDGDLIFVSKDKPMLLPYSKRLVPQSWNTLNRIFQTKHNAQVELNFFEYSDSKRFLHGT